MRKESNQEIGKQGEIIAVKYLKKNRYKILHTNYRCKIGEIDIVAQNKENIIFIEVKTRRDNEYGYPSESVTYHKQRKISKVALHYLQKYDLFKYNVRFDVIEVWNEFLKPETNHILNAFEFRE